jgi:hypothetical protein
MPHDRSTVDRVGERRDAKLITTTVVRSKRVRTRGTRNLETNVSDGDITGFSFSLGLVSIEGNRDGG